MSNYRYINKDTKQEVLPICINCGSNKDLHYHHVIPTTLGGSNNSNNLVCLCNKCHRLLHFGENIIFNHSELVKIGQQKAVKNGSKLGAKNISIQRIDSKIVYDIFRKEYGIINDKIINICKKHNISREKYYRLLHIFKNEIYGVYKPYNKYCSVVTREDFYNEPDGTKFDILHLGDEWYPDDKYIWIPCIKKENKLRIIGTESVYYLMEEIKEPGYEFIVKYHIEDDK